MRTKRKRAYHNPRGNPCDCGTPIHEHRVEHTPDGDPCSICGLSTGQHRKQKKESALECTMIGIDGEGQGKRDHRYVLLAASTADGKRTWIARPKPGLDRLTTEQCLDLILELPTRRARIFAYSFNYDLTKILTDCDDRTLYLLFRPNLRKRTTGKLAGVPKPVRWRGYKLNLQGTKFSVSNGSKRVVIWDLFKFFQSKFVTALKDWKVGNPELHARMQAMKEQRADFDKVDPEAVERYCLEECACIAQLAYKLIASHEQVELKLTSYYGAGSSGAAMLTYMGIRDKLAKSPADMAEAISSAFSGGRFENSVIGPIRQSLTNWDISSAYVYQLAFLPCLMHASWEHVTRREDLDKAEAHNGALVRYSLGRNPGYEAWGPFPFREKNGSICYPIESGGGWVWLNEYLQGERIFSHVQFHEAWIYRSNCDCRPFGQIPEFYNHRLKIGKEGPGIVIKLGMNSCYGKLAQSVGEARFNSWIWAGMITSGCRAQLLELLGLHENHADVLMMATDGLLTKTGIVPPAPLNTGTGASGKPLGGWERKRADRGMFIARPGIYFPLEPTEDELNYIRARGVGRSVVLKSWKAITDAWEKDGIDGVAPIANVARFCGAKTSISVSNEGKTFRRANARDGKRPSYGQWVSRRIELTFNPLPKRDRLAEDGVSLVLRKLPSTQTSEPYSRALARMSAEALEMEAATDEAAEQPDCDLTEYD